MDAPSKLLEKLDVEADLQQSGRCIYNCIRKLYALMGHVAQDMAGEAADQQEDAATLPSADISITSSKVGQLSWTVTSQSATAGRK